MIAKDLISSTILPLRTSVTGERALDTMNNFHIRHLPIVNEEKLLGTVSEEDIFDHDESEALGSYALSLSKAYVLESDHILDIIRKLAETRLTVIPVVDNEENYVGLITQENLIFSLAGNFAFSHPGGIVILETDRKQYSLAEIARIVESENAAILSTFVSITPDNLKAVVTVKINTEETQIIEASFERFGYDVVASFAKNDFNDTMMDRYESLIKFINV